MLPAGDYALALTVHMALVLPVIAGAPFIAMGVYERYFEGCWGWGSRVRVSRK